MLYACHCSMCGPPWPTQLRQGAQLKGQHSRPHHSQVVGLATKSTHDAHIKNVNQFIDHFEVAMLTLRYQGATKWEAKINEVY